MWVNYQIACAQAQNKLAQHWTDLADHKVGAQRDQEDIGYCLDKAKEHKHRYYELMNTAADCQVVCWQGK